MRSASSRESRNKKQTPITLRIGVTGHRARLNIRNVRKGVLKCLDGIAERNTRKPFRLVVLSPLAEGADRVVAQAALDWKCDRLGGPTQIEAILPMAVSSYQKDFKNPASKTEFRGLLKMASSCLMLPGTGNREDAYRNVGEYIVEHCDLMISVFDPTRIGGKSGTAEIVDFARKSGRTCWLVDPTSGRCSLLPGNAKLHRKL